jgi:hypothetical protein
MMRSVAAVSLLALFGCGGPSPILVGRVTASLASEEALDIEANGNVETVAIEDGRFELDGLPTGDVELVVRTETRTGTLLLAGVEENDKILVEVSARTDRLVIRETDRYPLIDDDDRDTDSSTKRRVKVWNGVVVLGR